MTMETTTPRSVGFWGKIGAGLLVIYATLIRGFIFWFERTRLHAVRVSVKTLWLFLTLWILFFALLPLEVESWQLWMTNKDLAKNLAFAIVATSFLAIEVGRIAHEAKRPLVGYYSYGLAALCTLLAVLSGWNYLMHSAEAMRGGGNAQAERSAEMLRQAQEDLDKHDKATAERLAILNASLQKADAGWAPTGTSRLNQSITDYEKQATTDRRELVKRVEDARSQAVVAHTDPRPIDVVLGNILFKGDASKASILLDLIRIVFFKAFLLMGLSLAFTPAPESAKKQEKEKLAAERARSMQGADGKFRPRKQAGLPQADTDNNSDWVAPEARVEKPKKAKSTKKGKRWLDDVFSKKAAENAQVEDAQFTEEPVEIRAAQMFDGLPEDGQNPQSEVSDEVSPLRSPDDKPLRAEEDGRSLLQGDPDYSPEYQSAIGGDEGDGSGTVRFRDGESLIHAQEEQQADERQDEVDIGSNVGIDAGDSGGDNSILVDVQVEDDAPLSSPDEQALWTEATETEEPANDGSQTRLPDGEGVIVWDDETDPTIKELLRKTEAAE